ncbi:VCBS repeat-containing protein (plasmid) [Agrobacterium tumefaciens]|uniref:FG-GAP repeat domain-containing protein n=1 Tax=Agrobacterium tumefaciens TaxID=358 RepID=UPI000E0A31FF|nr:VCBS repeat-containing protein [Agrobacterium tumefaciens]WQE43314.1 VCBS repeat-containing protein [Agrobacterium tumefaciens]
MIPNTLRAAMLTFTALAGLPAMAADPQPAWRYWDATASNVPLASNLHALDAAMADVDSDGDLDVIVAVEMDASRLYLNDGKGKLTLKSDVFGGGIHDNEHVRVTDFNGDGKADVIFVAEEDGEHQLYFGDGKGNFTNATNRLPGKSQGNALAIGDVNGDGLTDIVVGNSAESRRGAETSDPRDFLWLSDAERLGYFIDASETHLPSDKEDAQGIALADLDGDGDLDMVVANQTPPNRLLLNDGTGHFTDATDYMERTTPLESREVHIFDANADGKQDILFFNLTSNNQGWDKDPQTRLLINDESGRFVDNTNTHLPKHKFSSWGGTVTDFNGDGKPDLLVSAIDVPGFKALQVKAWQNDGTGKFTDVTADVVPKETVGRSWSMATGDLDGDGRADIFIGGWGTQARLLLTGERDS